MKVRKINKEITDQNQKILIALFERHWLHCQHVENERAQFMQVFAAIFAGFIVGYGYLVNTGTFVGDNLTFFATTISVLLFLIMLTFLGFFLTLRWVHTFEWHRQRVSFIADELNPYEYIDLTMKIPTMETGKFSESLKTRYFFPSFYIVVLLILAGLGQWLIIYFLTNLSISQVIFLGIIFSFLNWTPMFSASFVAIRGFKSIKEVKNKMDDSWKEEVAYRTEKSVSNSKIGIL